MHASIFLQLAVFIGIAASSALHFVDPRDGAPKYYTQCVEEGQMAIAFDDGPWIYEPYILDVLKQANITATFFLNTNNYGCIYNETLLEQVRAVIAANHVVGCHGERHLDLTTLNDTQRNAEIGNCLTGIKKVTGYLPAFFRPPYGAQNADVLKALAAFNLTAVGWDEDTEDSKEGATYANSKAVVDDMANSGFDQGMALWLMHETYEFTAKQLLQYIIDVGNDQGFTFVTVPECLGMKGMEYQSIGQPAKRDFTWHC
ncbi:unnamed protein product [Mycena citricolor]|uniref:NodB homology domain-containing protein n=1 Tax=Mycena citricolor TaxID=2018698 RepID=A0AAD2I212_9AGAR|nr:unnamed protein product [Mycena citricolor]CAK5284995.1 unnamed protein product [Mycena citricolor]